MSLSALHPARAPVAEHPAVAPEHDGLLARVAAAEARALELEEQQERLEATVRALRAASRVTEDVASAFQRERVLAAIPDALTCSFGAAIARVWLLGPADRCGDCPLASRCQTRTRCLHLVEHGGLGALDLALARVPIGDFSVGRVAAVGGLVATNDLASEPGLADPDWARIERLRAFAGHALVHEGRLLGVVAMWSREPIRDETLEALRVLARHAATAIAGAQLIDDVRQQSARSSAATRRLEALLESSRSGVIMFEPDGRTAYANGAFRRLFQLGDHSALVGIPLEELEERLQERLEEKGPPVLASIEDGDRDLKLRGDARAHILRRYSSIVWGERGEPVGWMDVFDDVTQAHEVDQMKSEFISTVSHELRTPLTSIKGSMALLLDGGGLDEESQELVQVTKRNADRLVRLVNDILDISKIEAGKLELSLAALSPAQLARAAVVNIDGFAKKVSVDVQLALADGLPLVVADADRVEQVLTNLLSNALKFSPKGSRVLVTAAQREGFVVFRVQDQGPGIPKEAHNKLFKRFAQLDRARREQAGTGLGLAICAALVAAQGGAVSVESEPGKGATFSFTLPVAPAAGSIRS